MKSHDSPQDTPVPVQRDRFAAWLIPLGIAVIVFLVFAPSLRNQFINWDDERNLTANLWFRGLGLTQLRWMFTTFLGGPYMPLTWLSFALDYAGWGMKPVGYHLTNLVLHALNAFLLYRIAVCLFKKVRSSDAMSVSWGAALTALVFALHPLRVESVAWATERKDVLSGFFYLLTILIYIKAPLTSQALAKRRQQLRICLVLYGLALLSKASTMTLPAVLVLLDFYPLKRFGWTETIADQASGPAVIKEKIPFFIAALGAAFLAAHGQVTAGLAANLHQLAFDQRLALAAYSAVFYLRKFVIPVGLIPLYTADLQIGFDQPLYLMSGLLLVVLSGLLWMKRKTWPSTMTAWFYFLIVLSPMSGIFQSGSQMAADRYTYLSFMGLAVWIGGAALNFWDHYTPRGRFLLAANAVVLLGLWSLLTARQIAHWRNANALWSYVLTQDPANAFADYNLGDVLQKEGRFDEARVYLEKARALDEDPAVDYKLGAVAEAQQQIERADTYYRRTLELKPAHADAAVRLARLLESQHHPDEAMAVLQHALTAAPAVAMLHNNLGVMYLNQHHQAEATQEFAAASQEEPENNDYRNNLQAAQSQQARSGAILRSEAALTDHPRDVIAHSRLGVLYLQSGDYPKAEIHFRACLNLEPVTAQNLNNLGVALVAQNKLDGLAYLERAVKLDPTSDNFRRNRDAARQQFKKG